MYLIKRSTFLLISYTFVINLPCEKPCKSSIIYNWQVLQFVIDSGLKYRIVIVFRRCIINDAGIVP